MTPIELRAAHMALGVFIEDRGLAGKMLRIVIKDGAIDLQITHNAMLDLMDAGQDVRPETGIDWHSYSFTDGSITCSSRCTDAEIA